MVEDEAPAAGANATEPQRSIALVDDDRNILTTLSIALQTEGYAIRVYSDGEAALKALTENPPDLAVFDIKMPRMDGMELLRRLRETSDLPVIFLTSKDEEQDEEAGLAMGPARHRVTWAGRPVSLTVTEFLILEALAQRPGVIKSRNQLMDAAYPDDVFVDDRTVDSHIKRLRRKFRSADPEFGAIETLYGAGYSFAEA